MSKIIATDGKILYTPLILDSMRIADYEFRKDDPKSILVWFDTLKRKNVFKGLKPWQIVNRLPNSNVMCRKAPFVRLIDRISKVSSTFEAMCRFLPESFIVPIQHESFVEAFSKSNKKYIVKPDNGSLGEGIKILEPGDEVTREKVLSVAQEYIPSFHLDGYKFDFRIFVLLSSLDPLRVHVYRNGVARFCSKKATEHSVFSELTNKSLNKKNPDVNITQIVKLVADVMQRLKKEGHDTDLLWQRIDRSIVTTIISSIKFLREGMKKQCPKMGMQKCFQIFGFDVLLDEELNPYILEVNYRPSLETNASYERKMKMSMLSDAMKIVSPAPELQEYVNKNYSPELEEKWEELLLTDKELQDAIEKTNSKPAQSVGGFALAYPTENPTQMKKWQDMMDVVMEFPIETGSKFSLPVPVKQLSHEEIVKARERKAKEAKNENKE